MRIQEFLLLFAGRLKRAPERMPEVTPSHRGGEGAYLQRSLGAAFDQSGVWFSGHGQAMTLMLQSHSAGG